MYRYFYVSTSIMHAAFPWFSQSWLTKRGVPRRDRELLENRPIIFLALRPRSRAGGRGGSAKISPKVIDSDWR
eukprot:COSAG02_NODE_207_length_29119_cov_41.071365_25_plen_73_part_00